MTAPASWVIPEPAAEPAADTADADTICPLCNDPIGYGRRFIEDREHGLVHRDCWLDRYESKPADYGTPFAEWYPCPEAVQWAGVA